MNRSSCKPLFSRFSPAVPPFRTAGFYFVEKASIWESDTTTKMARQDFRPRRMPSYEGVLGRAWLLDDTDRALVRDGEGYALLRIRSGQLIRLDCDRAAPYGDTLLRIRRNGRYGLMDFEGRTIIPPRYDLLTNHFSQFNIISRRGRYGLLNRQGGWAQPLRYDVIPARQPTGQRSSGCIRRHKVVFL